MTKPKHELSEQELRQIPLAALFASLGVIFPQFFHLLGLGATFLPMFLPVMMGSLLLTWKFALSLAVISPLASFLLTGMPPIAPPILPLMIGELIVSSLLLSAIHVHWKKSIWIALPVAIAADRLLLFLVAGIIAPLFGWPRPFLSLALVISGLPGVVLQIIILPLAIKLIRKYLPNRVHQI
jgi:niacin transporter